MFSALCRPKLEESSFLLNQVNFFENFLGSENYPLSPSTIMSSLRSSETPVMYFPVYDKMKNYKKSATFIYSPHNNDDKIKRERGERETKKAFSRHMCRPTDHPYVNVMLNIFPWFRDFCDQFIHIYIRIIRAERNFFPRNHEFR